MGAQFKNLKMKTIQKFIALKAVLWHFAKELKVQMNQNYLLPMLMMMYLQLELMILKILTLQLFHLLLSKKLFYIIVLSYLLKKKTIY